MLAVRAREDHFGFVFLFFLFCFVFIYILDNYLWVNWPHKKSYEGWRKALFCSYKQAPSGTQDLKKVESYACSHAWCLHLVWEWFISACWEVLMGHHLLSISRHPSLCSGLALLLPGKGWERQPMGHECIAAVSAVNIYICFSLHMGRQDVTETQLQSCLPSQHVLRYKYFYSFSFGYLWSAFWVQWKIYSVMFGRSCIFWGWCREKQDAQSYLAWMIFLSFTAMLHTMGWKCFPSPLTCRGRGRVVPYVC